MSSLGPATPAGLPVRQGARASLDVAPPPFDAQHRMWAKCGGASCLMRACELSLRGSLAERRLDPSSKGDATKGLPNAAD